ncbi:enoyl-CoA hydratase/carnithine racemase [Phenylobacterium zucineum HLK1]|uniref:Enoyl-CoA hydratase/carnithine racemase n=1 Tax=Phenylobacterium zucineum (strain HLK1) TaxID=450851 RepID=B4RH25_PHEZH|nr:enoyl-CoA hydratase/isomerase family protein [Phenylobacterium zucineum]ACG78973.1 enoyl-CoA hydratase/carnithine racemase [Phenylobacterium zucineum HLK1]
MPELTQVRLQRDGARATLTFLRPAELNALSPTLIAEAQRCVSSVAQSDAGVLVLAAEGRSFSAGVDLKAVSSPDYTPEVARLFSEQARDLIRQLETMPQVTIARVTGHCFTGGLEVALGCDFIVAAQDAVFADTHAKLGFRAGWGLSQRLPRRIGLMRAKEMSFTARRVSAAQAVELGLILDAVPAEALDRRIDDLVSAVTENSAGSIAAYKVLYDKAQNEGLEAGLTFEATVKLPIADREARLGATTRRLGSGSGPAN